MKLATDEAAVIAKIVRWTEGDERVRAALLTSSRVNPQAPLDILSDYDVALLVSDPHLFTENEVWVDAFGPPLLRVRDTEEEFGLAKSNCMVLYDDGTKIDYSLWPVVLAEHIAERSSLPDEFDNGFRVLLDKDQLTCDWPPPSHSAYIPKKPTAAEYQALIEEFWFVATYVAKNLWRGEFIPAKVIFDYELKYLILRRFLEWRIEIDRGWTVQPGFFGRGLQRFLDAETWHALRETYAGPDRAEQWQALWRTIDLFRRVAITVAHDLGYDYPQAIDAQLTAYLRQIAELPSPPTAIAPSGHPVGTPPLP